MKNFLKAVFGLIILFLGFGASFYYFVRPVGKSTDEIVFVVPQKQTDFDLSESLLEKGIIRNGKAFDFLLNNLAIGKITEPGGYKLNKGMNSWEIIKKITGSPDYVWLTISSCQRKEQIGEKIAAALGWDSAKLAEWNNLYKTENKEYYEGVYYPDTYLLPKNGAPEEIAGKFIANFNEKFAPYADEYISKNIKWTTGLKIASLIAREAGGTSDMKLISGIIWNRLNENMPLQIDATMQYTLGKNASGSWWGAVDTEERKSDSPYNSYKYTGLPPTPICSPNIDAIKAALNPEETDCIFYLHDNMKQIHCAVTYKEHLANIKEYLN